jgi:wobble nucleotide-excising tRNase
MAAESDFTALYNERRQSVNDLQSCTLGNQTANGLSKVIEKFLATFMGKTDYSTLLAPSGK